MSKLVSGKFGRNTKFASAPLTTYLFKGAYWRRPFLQLQLLWRTTASTFKTTNTTMTPAVVAAVTAACRLPAMAVTMATMATMYYD